MVNRFTDDGKTMGQGHLVAVPPAIQYVGAFYNKALLSQLGVTDVSTIDSKDAFLALLDKAKTAGLLPVMLGDSDKWPALHNLSLLNGWYVTPQAISDWVFNKVGSTYNDAGHIQGGQDFRTGWPTATSTRMPSRRASTMPSHASARARACSISAAPGRSATSTSRWVTTSASCCSRRVRAGRTPRSAATACPFIISSKSKNPDCAAAFINYVTASPEAIQAQIAAGRPSAALAGADATIDNPLLKQMVGQYQKLLSENGLFTWEDWPTPTMFTLMGSESPAAPGWPGDVRGLRQEDPGQLGQVHGDRPVGRRVRLFAAAPRWADRSRIWRCSTRRLTRPSAPPSSDVLWM